MIQNGMSPAELALTWVYSREFITSTIIGGTNIHHLRENMRAMNCPVTEDAYERIREVYDV